MFKIFRSSVLAGICIAMGGTAFLKVGGLWGAIMFSFGLLTVVHYALKLYTGTAGFFDPKKPEEWVGLPIIIFGNLIGCSLMAMLIGHVQPELVDAAYAITTKRDLAGGVNCFLNAICCGFIMTTAVQFGRKNHFLPLLFGVPLFIMCGFTHSIADIFYFLLGASEEHQITPHISKIWTLEIFGNFIGCNMYRMLCLKTQ